MHHRPIVKKLLVGLALSATALMAGPITTVPWNGYPGAVTFTYDDARTSQLPNLIPQLDALGIKATFFVPQTGAGGNLAEKKDDWIKVAKNGHELANHTYSHKNAADAPDGIAQMASYLRAMDPSIQSVTFAYPNCAEGAQTQVSAENFIGRDCGDMRYGWASEPSNWMLHQGLILSKSAQAGITAIDDAKSNKWATLIVHDVVNNPPDYSLSVSDNKSLLDKAIANKLWIGTYQEVGAYYRAHFTMDKVTASGAGPWNLTWTSPHAKMPKSVKLKVKLDKATFGNTFTVSQDGAAIAANTDGSYTIDFMKLKLAVTAGSSGISRKSGSALGEVSMRRTASEIVMTGIGASGFDLTVRNLKGRILASKRFDARSDAGSESLAMDPALAGTPLLAVISATDGSGLRSVPLAPVR